MPLFKHFLNQNKYGKHAVTIMTVFGKSMVFFPCFISSLLCFYCNFNPRCRFCYPLHLLNVESRFQYSIIFLVFWKYKTFLGLWLTLAGFFAVVYYYTVVRALVIIIAGSLIHGPLYSWTRSCTIRGLDFTFSKYDNFHEKCQHF